MRVIDQLAWTPKQFAQLIGRHKTTVLRYIRDGELRAVRAGHGESVMIPRAAGLRFLGMTEKDVSGDQDSSTG